ncbi:MAG: ParB/RepB/Spo0J family partition protein [Clostridia bacterium]|nr:ParB/RepB/Spo0J family partition protein [Clostridia bacterium]
MIIQIPVEKIFPHPNNPRKDLGDLTELADSIRTNGIFQNLTVVPRDEDTYYTIIGHRRHAASKLAGLETVPCAVAEMDEKQQVSTMLAENMQRADLTAYEQAQGFQMMLDLGCSEEDIAAKTGFSKSTVKRRLKMAELDAEKLREVSSRQIYLSDIDELGKIEDIGQRNELLEVIGTSDFRWSLSNALRLQERKHCQAAYDSFKSTITLKKMESNEQYSSNFERLGKTEVLAFKDDYAPAIPEGATHYHEDWSGLYFFKKKPGTGKEKRPPEELEREAAIAKAHKDIAKCAETMYELRRQFIRNLRVGKGNISNILQGAIYVATLSTRIYLRSTDGHKDYYEVLGVVTDDLTLRAFNENNQIIFNRACEKGIEIAAIAIYYMFGDSVDEKPSSSFIGAFPEHKYNWKLDVLYRWLELLGYEMSTIERALMDGTHEVFQRGNQYEIQEETV